MDVTPLVREGQNIIQSYGQAGFKISGNQYDKAVAVLPERVIDWPSLDFLSVATADFDCLRDQAINVLLIGTGAQFQRLQPHILADIKQKGFASVDAMDTGAACRTYNVLMAEGRRVAAILYPC